MPSGVFQSGWAAKMIVCAERQGTFTLNGSTSAEKLNKPSAASIVWHRGLFFWRSPEDAPFAVCRSAVLKYSSPVD